MDPAQDRLVEIYHPIRCQEKDALVILEFSEKNGHKTIMGIMVRFALLHKRICLVQEKHGVEVLGNLEYALKPLLEHSGISKSGEGDGEAIAQVNLASGGLGSLSASSQVPKDGVLSRCNSGLSVGAAGGPVMC